MTNEFKDALDGLRKAENGNALKLGGEIYTRHDWCDHHIPAIHKALLIADKLMQEPSNEMYYAGINAFNNPTNEYGAVWNGVFNAIRDQMLEEVGQ